MPHHTVHTCAPIIKIVISQNYQDRVLSLLPFHQNSIAAEELEVIHSRVGQGDDGVVIVDGVSDTVGSMLTILRSSHRESNSLHQGVWLLLLLEDGRCRVVDLGRHVRPRFA